MADLAVERVPSGRFDALAVGAHERRLPVEEALSALLPQGGIRRGTAVSVGGHGATTLAMALAAEASRRGSWVAVVGMADLGVTALAERDVDLQRWVLLDPPERGRGPTMAADVLGAAVGGFDLVLLGPAVRVAGATARRLLARMRDHGTSLICALSGAADGSVADMAAGLQPEVRLSIEQPRWSGIDDGHGRLLARRVEVAVEGRGAASRPRRMLIWLPSEDGRVIRAEPDQATESGRRLEDAEERLTG